MIISYLFLTNINNKNHIFITLISDYYKTMNSYIYVILNILYIIILYIILYYVIYINMC